MCSFVADERQEGIVLAGMSCEYEMRIIDVIGMIDFWWVKKLIEESMLFL
mgnify:CR=1 FL=1